MGDEGLVVVRGEKAEVVEDGICFGQSDVEEDAREEATSPLDSLVSFHRETLCDVPVSLAPPIDEEAFLATPILISHGSADEKISRTYGLDTCEIFTKAGFASVKWELYDGLEHRMPDGIDEFVDFIRDRVGWEVAEGA